MAGKKQGKPQKVEQFRKPVNINIGMIVFLVILVYVLYSVFRYATTEHVVGYEVRTGSLQANRVYTGIAIRDEEVVPSQYAGYINFYTREGDRIGAGKLACTIDESGEVAEALNSGSAEDTVFTDEDYDDIRSQITSFYSEFDPAQFSSVYDFKNQLAGTVQKISNSSILSDIENAGSDSSIHYCNTDNTGYIVYAVDGYEALTFDAVTASNFNTSGYENKTIENNQLVSVGDAAYKLETNEDWSIAIQLDSDETAQQLSDLGVVKVRFLKNQLESYATVTTKKDGDGRNYANLALTNSMMTFCTDRYINIELITDDTTGLKIPVSALVDDSFFVVPEDYVTEGTGGSQVVLRQSVTDAGQTSAETVKVTPYYQDSDGNYYLDDSSLRSGDVLVKEDSDDTFTIGETAQLTGVYNINEGYADFRGVTVLAQNDDYAIVASNSMYGLREYDFIVLDAASMTPDQFVYE